MDTPISSKIFNVKNAAADLAHKLRARVASAAALDTAARPLSAVMVTISDGKVYALSGANYKTVPAAIGLKNVWGFTKKFSEVSAEVVVAATPGVILITYAGGKTEKAEALAQARQCSKRHRPSQRTTSSPCPRTHSSQEA